MSCQPSSSQRCCDDPGVDPRIGKPCVFLICGLVTVVIALSLTMPTGLDQQKQGLAALNTPHLDRAGTLGIIEENGRVYPVFYPDAKTPIRENAPLVLAGTVQTPEIFVGIITDKSGTAPKTGTYRQLAPSPDYVQHPVFALPRSYDGKPVYYQVDLTASF